METPTELAENLTPGTRFVDPHYGDVVTLGDIWETSVHHDELTFTARAANGTHRSGFFVKGDAVALAGPAPDDADYARRFPVSSTVHNDCETCESCRTSAYIHAAATGSTGATYIVTDEAMSVEHAATVGQPEKVTR